MSADVTGGMRCKCCGEKMFYGTWVDGRGPYCQPCAVRSGYTVQPGTVPATALTEADVRRIVREELRNYFASVPTSNNP